MMCLECMFTVPGELLRRVVRTVVGPVDAWIARTHDLITRRGGRAGVFDPSHPRSRGTVHRFLRITPQRRLPYKAHGSECAAMDSVGFEPTASSLQRRHSAAEL